VRSVSKEKVKVCPAPSYTGAVDEIGLRRGIRGGGGKDATQRKLYRGRHGGSRVRGYAKTPLVREIVSHSYPKCGYGNGVEEGEQFDT
jgi:hypothetical protein